MPQFASTPIDSNGSSPLGAGPSTRPDPAARPLWFWLFSLLVVAGVMASFYSRGEGSRMPIVDGLDSYLPAHAKLVTSDVFLGRLDSVFQPILGGIPRSCLPSETRLFLWLYRCFSPFQACVAMEAIQRVVALVGMVLLLRRHVLPRAPAVLTFGASLCFALLPFYVHADLSVAGQPLIAYALINIRGRDMSLWNWLIVALFPFTSSLPFVGFAFIPLVAAWVVAELLLKRKFPAGLAVALIVLTAGYGASEYRLFAELFGRERFVSHRTEFVRESASLRRIAVRTAENLVGGDGYVPSVQNFVIAPAAVLALAIGLVLSRRDARAQSEMKTAKMRRGILAVARGCSC